MIRTEKSRTFFLALAALVAALVIFFGESNRHPNVKDVSVSDAKELIDAGAVVVDVRERSASAPSHIPGALLIPLDVLSTRLAEWSIDKSTPIVVYCNEGTVRGPKGTAVLNQAGYSQAVNLKSGIEGWRAASLPTQATK